jgi:glycosyltransferase involved in cell wall biosynthesis
VRVLYANHTGRVSGGELSLLGLLGALPAGLDAAVACPEGPLAGRVRELGIEVIPVRGTDGSLRLHPLRTPVALAEMGWAAIGLRRAAARFGADLVHANSIRAGLVAVGAARGGARPSIVHVRDCLPPGRASALALRAIARADALIANSAYTRSRLGPTAGSAYVVHNAVDLSRFDAARLPAAAARARLGLDGRGPVLAVIAQITPWKGQDDAIRIVAALRGRHPRLRLLLVGSPVFDSAATRHDNRAYLEALRRQVAEGGLGAHVAFLGAREDVPEILAAVDLLLVPSWEEPFGRAVVEAMAAGVPVAATGVGGPAEIVDRDRSGLLLPPRSPRRWAEALGPLLADPARLAAMGRNGREAARRRFGLERHAARIADVYRAVLSGEGPSARAAR